MSNTSDAICIRPGPSSESDEPLPAPPVDESADEPPACDGGAAKLGEIMLAAACINDDPPDPPEPLPPPPKKLLIGEDEDDGDEDPLEPAVEARAPAASEPAAFWMPCEANIPGLKSGLSVVDDGPPASNDWNACIANELGADEPPPPPPLLPESPEAWVGVLPVAELMMLASGDEPNADIKGDGELAGSSSSPKKLLMADIAGLKPAIARGVNKSDGISGAENNSPKLRGFDNRPEAILPNAPACLSDAGFGRTKKGAWSGTAPPLRDANMFNNRCDALLSTGESPEIGAERELLDCWCLSDDTSAAVAAAAAIGPALVMNEGNSFLSNDNVARGLFCACCAASPLFL